MHDRVVLVQYDDGAREHARERSIDDLDAAERTLEAYESAIRQRSWRPVRRRGASR